MEPSPYDYVPEKAVPKTDDTPDEFKKPSPPTHRIAQLRGRNVQIVSHSSAIEARVTTLQQRNPPLSVEDAKVKPVEQQYDGMWEANLPYNASLDQGKP